MSDDLTNLAIGDLVWLQDQKGRGQDDYSWPTEGVVKKVGRRWLTVAYGWSEMLFDRHTGRSKSDGNEWANGLGVFCFASMADRNDFVDYEKRRSELLSIIGRRPNLFRSWPNDLLEELAVLCDEAERRPADCGG